MASIAVVGVGYWGPNLVRNYYELPACTELWVCDKDPDRLSKIRKRYGDLYYTENFDDVLASDVDGIVLATPVGTHHPLAMKALNAGKHVFVEKPLAHSVAAAEELVATASAKDLRLMVGHTFEYSPAVVKIRDLVHSGELGKVYFISSMRVNLGLHQKDVSVIWDLAAHDFSILFTWLDETPETVSVMGSACVQDGIPDVAFISVRFPSGVVAHVEVSWLAPSKLRRTTVVGDKKMLVYDDTEAIEKVKIFDRGVDVEYRDPQNFGEFQLSYRTGDITSPALETFEPLALEAAEFMGAIEDGRTPRSDGQSGLRVVRALEAAQRSLEQGGQPVKL
jgi:predicted dehydrogenase